MGAILKGIQSVLIALGIIAVIGTGVILYYNMVKPEEEQTASAEAQVPTEPGMETADNAAETEETETETAETEESAADPGLSSGDASASGISPESGHEHTYTDTVLRPATCTQTGEMKHTCYCGDSYVDAIPVLEHTPGQWITVRSATATQTGLRQKSCTTCGRVIEEETLPMLAAPVTTSTDTDKNKEKDDKDSTDNHRHTYTYEISEEASCTEKGEKTYTCTVCGSTFETSIPATNHPSRKTVRTEGTCANPGKIEVICNICDAVISSETLSYDHDWSSWSTTTAPTATAEGVRTRTCRKCGEQQTKSISKLSGGSNGGSNSGSNGGSNSGSNGGSNGGNNGSNGGNNGSNDPSHKHTYTSSVTTAATCTEAGVTTYKCSCGDTYTEAVPEALGHKPTGIWVVTKKATTAEDGERVQYCSRCNEVVTRESIPKQQETHTHIYTDSVTRAATCTASGTKKHSCACGYYYTSSLRALGHKAGGWEEGSAEGTEVRKCTRCGQIMETRTVETPPVTPPAPAP